MKNLIAVLLLTVCSFAFAQETEEEEKETTMPESFLESTDSLETNRIKRTQFNTIFAIGWNQALGENKDIGEDYRFWGSGLWELGSEFSTKISKEDDLFRVNYGLAFQWQTLRINDNRQFETNDDITSLQPVGFDVDRSKFSQLAIIAPVHLEIGRGVK
jgi:hypothetical protein